MSSEIELQVDHHPSGRFTLKERFLGERSWRDVTDNKLFGNLDEATFYKAVAAKIAKHSKNGDKIVTYSDK